MTSTLENFTSLRAKSLSPQVFSLPLRFITKLK